MTESGKTTLGKQLCRIQRQCGFKTIVLDPMHDPEWQADFKTHSPDVFLRMLWQSRRCMAFIDEAGKHAGRFDDLMEETATESRHWGHSMFYLSQRGAMLSPTIRGQCKHLFLFAMAADDTKELARNFNCPQLKEANILQPGEYFHVTRFGIFERCRAWE